MGFFMDSPLTMEAQTETTAHLMWAATGRGHQIFIFDSDGLAETENSISAGGHAIEPGTFSSIAVYWDHVIEVIRHGPVIRLALEDLDALWYRKNPPLDRRAVQLMMKSENRPFMANHHQGLLKGAEKSYILNFPHLIPVSRIVSNHKQVRALQEVFQADVVAKPVDGYGGKGVIKGPVKEIAANLQWGPFPFMVQQFLPQVFKGDVRVLLLNGRVLGAMRRIPANGDFRSNVHAGGKVAKHDLSPAELSVCRAVKRRLVEDGLYFVGLDLIDGRLIEINCVSPGGIPRINHLNKCALQEQVIDFLEKVT